jgi:hypothetical protein
MSATLSLRFHLGRPQPTRVMYARNNRVQGGTGGEFLTDCQWLDRYLEVIDYLDRLARTYMFEALKK